MMWKGRLSGWFAAFQVLTNTPPLPVGAEAIVAPGGGSTTCPPGTLARAGVYAHAPTRVGKSSRWTPTAIVVTRALPAFGTPPELTTAKRSWAGAPGGPAGPREPLSVARVAGEM